MQISNRYLRAKDCFLTAGIYPEILQQRCLDRVKQEADSGINFQQESTKTGGERPTLLAHPCLRPYGVKYTEFELYKYDGLRS